MAYEQRDNSGTIFVNDRKGKDSHPDRAGTAMIDGVMYYVSGWIKQGSKGPFLSLAFKRKDEDRRSTSMMTPAEMRERSISERATDKIRKHDPISTGRNADMNDDIPFAPEFR